MTPILYPSTVISACWVSKNILYWDYFSAYLVVRILDRSRSTTPWIWENNPLLFLATTSSVTMPAILLSLITPVSDFSDFKIQSPTSNSLYGSGFDLFYTTVLNNPGTKLTLPVWNSLVLASAIVMSLGYSETLIIVDISALEHSAKFNASLYWAHAISNLNWSPKVFVRSFDPIVCDGGRVGLIFWKP